MTQKCISKMMNSWFVYLLYIIFFSTNLQAVNDAQKLILFSDAQLNSIFFQTVVTNNTPTIIQSIKPIGNPLWGPDFIISDPNVNVVSYSVEKDADDNYVVAWIGENRDFNIYSLYIRYYLKNINQWSPIITVSSPTQNLVGNYTASINTLVAEIVWTIYDQNYDIQRESATYTL